MLFTRQNCNKIFLLPCFLFFFLLTKNFCHHINESESGYGNTDMEIWKYMEIIWKYWHVSTLFVLLKRKDKNNSPSYLMTLHIDKLTNEDKETKKKYRVCEYSKRTNYFWFCITLYCVYCVTVLKDLYVPQAFAPFNSVGIYGSKWML